MEVNCCYCFVVNVTLFLVNSLSILIFLCEKSIVGYSGRSVIWTSQITKISKIIWKAFMELSKYSLQSECY